MYCDKTEMFNTIVFKKVFFLNIAGEGIYDLTLMK